MPAKTRPVERIDLKFRAAPATASRLTPPGGWWVWSLLGVACGLGGWLIGRDLLTRRLGDQLAEAQSPGEALLALEGLMMVDTKTSGEIVRGLQHSNLQIARSAYRVLETQIAGWQEQPAEVMSRMQDLAQHLGDLPQDTPAENLILASGLASRIYTICLEMDDPELASTIQICEQIILRSGTAQRDTESRLSDSRTGPSDDLAALQERIDSFSPPPPLPPETLPELAGGQFTAAKSLDDSPPDTKQPLVEDAPGSSARVAGTNAPIGEALPPVGAREAVQSSSSKPNTASFRLIASSTRPRTAARNASQVTAVSEDDGLTDAALGGAGESTPPELTHGPTAISNQPLGQVRALPTEPELDGIQDMAIEELVKLLGSVQPRVAQAAALTLRAKGLSDDKLELASTLATGSAATQLELIEQIATRSDLDPRPWLLWMAEDGVPEVRQQAVSLLHSMVDADVQRNLRVLLGRERDEVVAQAIRHVLLTGPGLQQRSGAIGGATR